MRFLAATRSGKISLFGLTASFTKVLTVTIFRFSCRLTDWGGMVCVVTVVTSLLAEVFAEMTTVSRSDRDV
jgi:hypothetical protein